MGIDNGFIRLIDAIYSEIIDIIAPVARSSYYHNGECGSPKRELVDEFQRARRKKTGDNKGHKGNQHIDRSRNLDEMLNITPHVGRLRMMLETRVNRYLSL